MRNALFYGSGVALVTPFSGDKVDFRAFEALIHWQIDMLTDAIVTEMSAVGGVLLIGLAINLLNLRQQPIKIANMLPAVFLPAAYVPLYNWITSLT